MGHGLLGQADGSPVGWVSPQQPSLIVPPFSSSSLLLQYSSAPSRDLTTIPWQGLFSPVL